jgi:hypothetical protein
LCDELVRGDDAEEDGERIEVSVDNVEKVQGNIPAIAKVAKQEAEDKAEGVQG